METELITKQETYHTLSLNTNDQRDIWIKDSKNKEELEQLKNKIIHKIQTKKTIEIDNETIFTNKINSIRIDTTENKIKICKKCGARQYNSQLINCPECFYKEQIEKRTDQEQKIRQEHIKENNKGFWQKKADNIDYYFCGNCKKETLHKEYDGPHLNFNEDQCVCTQCGKDNRWTEEEY